MRAREEGGEDWGEASGGRKSCGAPVVARTGITGISIEGLEGDKGTGGKKGRKVGSCLPSFREKRGGGRVTEDNKNHPENKKETQKRKRKLGRKKNSPESAME